MTELATEQKKSFGIWDRVKVQMAPPICDELLATMAKHITPLILHDGGHFDPNYYEIKNPVKDLRNVSFLWDATPGKLVGGFDTLDKVEIMTFHRWGYYGFFKPSIAEVMQCIYAYVPEWREVHYFHLHSKDLSKDNIIGNYQWCRCTLFGGPPEVWYKGKGDFWEHKEK